MVQVNGGECQLVQLILAMHLIRISDWSLPVIITSGNSDDRLGPEESVSMAERYREERK